MSTATLETPELTPMPSSQTQESIDSLLNDVKQVIAPVWPLKDYVAVNPYAGVSGRPFLKARSFLQQFSDCETLMPLSYFAKRFQAGDFAVGHIIQAVEEMGVRNEDDAKDWSPEALSSRILSSLNETDRENKPGSSDQVRPLSWYADHQLSINWSNVIGDEISKLCGSHYDDGHATWKSPWRHLSLYAAWKQISAIDKNVEILGLKEFRGFVQSMPDDPADAIEWLLSRSEAPTSMWKEYLLALAFTIPGWCAWTKYQSEWIGDGTNNDLLGLLAIRLAYDVALGEAVDVAVNWDVVQLQDDKACDDVTLRAVLLRASEIAFRDNLVTDMDLNTEIVQESRKASQWVFCIDVRSERIRRKLEQINTQVETFGFAGFFGMPVEFVPLGQVSGNSHVPALLRPQFQLHEGIRGADDATQSAVVSVRQSTRTWRKLWRGFQASAIGCFSFVETLGILYGWKLLKQTAVASKAADNYDSDGLASGDVSKLGPTLATLDQQGIQIKEQTDIAQGMLTGMGLKKNFARLVVFCGHESQTENNPLAAGLDCGACCGHSGAPNARMAALLLNHPEIRSGLAERGIEIPADTHFLGGVHNTTTDRLTFFDTADVPASHVEDLKTLEAHGRIATEATGLERMPLVESDTVEDLSRRASDWSEVRPEWGLAGNAAFIIAPRTMTAGANLDGRSFLHSYDFRTDTEGNVLEAIMTAPMVVAHWINMQYFASTVDNRHFGSGNKTVHNVVGQFGVLSGNGGDLMTGLPWQSLHTGKDYQHLPMRLQAVIAAPRTMIETVLSKHANVADLVVNQWMHLIAIEDGQAYQYGENGEWSLV